MCDMTSLTIVIVVSIFSLTMASSKENICDGVPPNTFVCDPTTEGIYFFLCTENGVGPQSSCVPPLRFNNAIQSCHWSGYSKCSRNALAVPSTSTTITNITTNTKRIINKIDAQTIYRTTSVDANVTDSCTDDNCRLPKCRCPETTIPGNLSLADVPQIVLLTFDDGINPGNFPIYKRLFLNSSVSRTNPNGCPTKATFFVSGDYVDMKQVKTLADKGHEMASHTRTHSDLAGKDAATWTQEAEGMREDIAAGTGLSLKQICGFRAPYLDLGADIQYNVLSGEGFLYDSSIFTGSLTDDGTPPIWPYTLDYAPGWPTCDNPGCPTDGHPGFWQVPLIRQYTLSGTPCSMTDACDLGKSATVDDVVNYLAHNFNRHYSKNRAPFMISLHATWFSNVPSSLQGLEKFLASLADRKEVWQVSASQALDWIRGPLPLSRINELKSWQC